MTHTMSTESMQSFAAAMIRRHEGFSAKPKPDRGNTIQIGYGTNLTRRGVKKVEAELLLWADVTTHVEHLSSYHWWDSLSEARQIALIDMSYALGDRGFDGFQDMIGHLEKHHYELAADALLASDFAAEDRERAQELASIIRSGMLPLPKISS